jgi:hypothetical protein
MVNVQNLEVTSSKLKVCDRSSSVKYRANKKEGNTFTWL